MYTVSSIASSTGSHHDSFDSTMSFDPENEAICSTRTFNVDDSNLTQRLPELRDTAKKYGRFDNKPPANFLIDTSALARAFPDFTQGSASDESLSIEIGRGKNGNHRAVSLSDNSITSPKPTISNGRYRVVSTPPARGQSTKSTKVAK